MQPMDSDMCEFSNNNNVNDNDYNNNNNNNDDDDDDDENLSSNLTSLMRLVISFGIR